MKRCVVYFTGMSGEVYTDTIDGNRVAVETKIRSVMQCGLFYVTKQSDRDGYDEDRVWTLKSQAIESVCIEEFEEEEC